MRKTPVIITVQKSGELYHPTVVSVDATAPDERPPLHVRGEAGQLLYMALSGHRFGTSPDTAHPLIAAQARAAIQAYGNKGLNEQIDYVRAMPNGSIYGTAYDIIEVERQFLLAYRVVQCWGQTVKPWLGCFHERDGELIPHHPDYEQVMLLPTPQTWGQFNLMIGDQNQ